MHKPRSTVSAADLFRNFLIFHIQKKFAIALPNTYPVCFLKLSWHSRFPPRYLTWLLTVMRLPLSSKPVVVHLSNCLLKMNRISSVLSWFSLSLISDIQSVMSLTEFLSVSIVSDSAFWIDGLKLFLREWSSVYPLRPTDLSLITPSIGVQYATKLFAPEQLPCGTPYLMLRFSE